MKYTGEITLDILILFFTIAAPVMATMHLVYRWKKKKILREFGEYYARSMQEIPQERDPTPEEILEGMRRYGERLALRSQFLILRLRKCGCFVGKPVSACGAFFRWVMKEGNSKKTNSPPMRKLRGMPDFVESVVETAPISDRLAEDLYDWCMDLRLWLMTVEYLAESCYQKVRSDQESRRA